MNTAGSKLITQAQALGLRLLFKCTVLGFMEQVSRPNDKASGQRGTCCFSISFMRSSLEPISTSLAPAVSGVGRQFPGKIILKSCLFFWWVKGREVVKCFKNYLNQQSNLSCLRHIDVYILVYRREGVYINVQKNVFCSFLKPGSNHVTVMRERLGGT